MSQSSLKALRRVQEFSGQGCPVLIAVGASVFRSAAAQSSPEHSNDVPQHLCPFRAESSWKLLKRSRSVSWHPREFHAGLPQSFMGRSGNVPERSGNVGERLRDVSVPPRDIPELPEASWKPPSASRRRSRTPWSVQETSQSDMDKQRSCTRGVDPHRTPLELRL